MRDILTILTISTLLVVGFLHFHGDAEVSKYDGTIAFNAEIKTNQDSNQTGGDFMITTGEGGIDWRAGCDEACKAGPFIPIECTEIPGFVGCWPYVNFTPQ